MDMAQTTASASETASALAGRLADARAKALDLLRELDGIYEDAKFAASEDSPVDWWETGEDCEERERTLDICYAADMAANAMELARLAIAKIIGS